MSTSKEYKLRRTLTLGTVTIILIIWVIKLVIIFSLVWYARTHNPIEIAQRPAQDGTLETAADDVLIAPVDAAIAPPQITDVQNTHRGITISGTALPKSYVVFAFDQHGKSSAAPKFYTTSADEKGNFTLREDSSVFNLPRGEYNVSAITYDQLHNAKSAESRTFPLSVAESFVERLLHGSDAILNIVALLAIVIGLLATILVS